MLGLPTHISLVVFYLQMLAWVEVAALRCNIVRPCSPEIDGGTRERDGQRFGDDDGDRACGPTGSRTRTSERGDPPPYPCQCPLIENHYARLGSLETTARAKVVLNLSTAVFGQIGNCGSSYLILHRPPRSSGMPIPDVISIRRTIAARRYPASIPSQKMFYNR